MAYLVLSGLKASLQEKLEGYENFSVNQILQRALVQESRIRETKELHRFKSDRPRLNTFECEDDDEVVESTDIYAAEFVWPSKAKLYTCDVLKTIQKNRDDEMNFTFKAGKCDKIFDALLEGKFINLSHAIPPPEELRRHAYCKFHNSISHTINDCNVFRR